MHLIPRLSGCGVWGYGLVEVRLRREQRAVDQQTCWRTVRRFTTVDLVTKPAPWTVADAPAPPATDVTRVVARARCEL